MTLEPGTILQNRYLIEEVISQGGMGAIYRATDESLKISVAVKENFFREKEYTRQFHREATILASLRHPNLPRVTDHFIIPDEGQYLVMDYIAGEDLRQKIKSGPMPENEVIKIGVAICDALTHMHTHKPAVVHRDIKPGNIKINPEGRMYLVDFGLAKFHHPGQPTTMAAQALTPGYSPPEQYGEGTDPRSDIYSLGATLYAVVSGQIPEDGLAIAMGNVKLTPLRDHAPAVSQTLADILNRAMSSRRDDRYQTADEFKQALMVLSGESVSASPISQEFSQPAIESPSPRPAPRSFSYFPRVMLLTVILLGAVAGGFWYFNRSRTLPAAPAAPAPTVFVPAASTPTVVVPPTLTAQPPQEEPLQVTPGLPSRVIKPTIKVVITPQATPNGGGSGQIAFVSDRSGVPQIWLMHSLPDRFPEQITDIPSGACQPDWSPDGSQLVFISPCSSPKMVDPIKDVYENASMFIINADGSGLRGLKTVPGGDFDPAWSPDGKTIVFSTLRDTRGSPLPHLYLYNLEDDTVAAITGDMNKDRHPAWSPDGKYIVFQREQVQRKIWILDLEGGELKPFSGSESDFTSMPAWSINDIITFGQGKNFPALYIQQFPTGGEATRTFTGPVWYAHFSPDALWVVFQGVIFEGEQGRNYEIYLMPWNGGVITALTDNPNSDYQPAWRP